MNFSFTQKKINLGKASEKCVSNFNVVESVSTSMCINFNVYLTFNVVESDLSLHPGLQTARWSLERAVCISYMAEPTLGVDKGLIYKSSS